MDERHPLKKLDSDEEALLRLLQCWRDEAAKVGRRITRIAIAFEAGRDGFCLARWPRLRGIETYVIHSTSVAVRREHRRATQRRYSAEDKIRIVISGLRGEDSIVELRRQEGISQNLHYRWSKEFLEAIKKRLAGDTARKSWLRLARTLAVLDRHCMARLKVES